MKYFKMNDNLYYVNEPHVKKNIFLSMETENGEILKYEDVKNKLPEPVWEGHQSTIDCYYKTWEIGWNNIKKANKDAKFVSDFIDTAFNRYLFMWDSSFIVMFGKYASRYFDFQKTLDNFYAHQHKDGFICREICEYQEGEQWQRDDPASTGPNILAWSEWENYCYTGNKERLSNVFDPLCAYHNWLRLNRSWQDGTYWSCGLASGMDNSPRQDAEYDDHLSHGFMSWIDACAQQYLSATILIKMAKELGREDEVESYKKEAKMLAEVINNKMWDEKTAFYYDTRRDGKISGVKTIASYWTMIAGLVPESRIDRFVEHLTNKKEFNRVNRIPSLSADHPLYKGNGGYWRGAVWAPTNYMTLCGLHKYGYDDLAYEIAKDYLKTVIKVFEEKGTVFENYASDCQSVGICDWVENCSAKKDFVGWTGLASISILFEYVFGIHPNVQDNEIVWNINLEEKFGIKKYAMGNATIDLICEKIDQVNDEPVIKVKSDKPFTLKVNYKGKSKIYKNITEIN